MSATRFYFNQLLAVLDEHGADTGARVRFTGLHYKDDQPTGNAIVTVAQPGALGLVGCPSLSLARLVEPASLAKPAAAPRRLVSAGDAS